MITLFEDMLTLLDLINERDTGRQAEKRFQRGAFARPA